MTRVVHLHRHLLQSSLRYRSKKPSTLINESICFSPLLLCCISLCCYPFVYLLPILHYYPFCFWHILLWLACIIVPIPTFPFHFIFPTGSVRAWLVICDWFDNRTRTCSACPSCWRWQPPGDSRIIHVVKIVSEEVNLLQIVLSFGRSSLMVFAHILSILSGLM